MTTETANAIKAIKRSLLNLKRIAPTTPDHEDARALHLKADYIADYLAAIEADAVAEYNEFAEVA